MLPEQFKQLDFHPRFREEFRERTKVGGVVSICSLALMAYLFIWQLILLFTPESVEVLSVDSSRGSDLRINFDVTFPSMPCSLVSLDVMDLTGHHQTGVMNNVFKKRLDELGRPFDESQRNELGQSVTDRTKLAAGSGSGSGSDGDPADGGEGNNKKDGSDGTPECGSCYGAGSDGQCCNTCAEVQALYRAKGWSFDAATITQCARDAMQLAQSGEMKEGCNVYGYVQVKRVAGNIHFAPGRSFRHSSMRIEDLLMFTLQSFNVSHTVNTFSFGTPIPGQERNPLDGVFRVRKAEEPNGMYQYYLKVVPTDHVNTRGSRTSTNQYSVTEHFRPVSISRGNSLPGVFFYYDLSPIRVTIEDRPRSFGHFLTSCCAIIGGVFTVMGVVDTAVHSVIRRLKAGSIA